MLMLRRSFSLFAAFLLSSCAIGPDYEAPKIDFSPSYQNASGEMNSEVKAEVLWWQSFDDDLLQELIAEAVKENYSVKQALTRINQSRAQAKAAFAELLPGALLNGNYLKVNDPGIKFPGAPRRFNFETYSGSVDALWEIDIFGRLRRELEARNAEFDVQVAELHDAIRMLIAEVAGSYFELRAAQAQYQIALNNKKIQSESLDLVKTKFEFGEVSELDVALSTTQLAQTEATIPSREAAVRVQGNRLAVLLGKQPGYYDQRFAEIREIPKYVGPVTIGSPEALLRSRPDLRRVERKLAAANARIGTALGELFPKITVSGSLGVQASVFNQLDRNAYFYNFGPSISWAAFDTGRLRNQVDVREQQTEEALLVYEEAVLKALEEVENAMLDYTAENKRQYQLLLAADSSRKAHTIASEQYKEGVLDFLEVLSTERTLLSSEQDVIEGRKQLALSLVALYKALGGGWEAWELQEVEGK